ncbi:hypothetical protein [Intrasporangium sp.]|uniref:hypothetical protein n=1 Tax=Intrasporangium sp. TaxID=1925024 RepID=UPI00293B6CEA|nr:hypothetical protein [Intrasporangium sp.]MDV3219959.1 hypothetical protein [Intrasporangium sp.]
MDQPGQTPGAGDEIDPVVQARIRELLAAAPDPGPMPEHVTQRIETLLSDEVALRVDPGPLARTGHALTGPDHRGPNRTGQDQSGQVGAGQGPADPDHAVLAPLIRQRQRPRPLFAVAAVAAAAAVVAVGGSALHLNKGTNGTPSLGDANAIVATPRPPTLTPTGSPAQSSTTAGPIAPPVGPTNPSLHIQLSSTNYTAADLPLQARAMLTNPGPPVQVLAAEAPTLGPIATEVGLEDCLGAHSLPTDVPVHVDIATYEGRPAAIIVVTDGGRSTVRVVERTCSTGNPAPLTQATPVP